LKPISEFTEQSVTTLIVLKRAEGLAQNSQDMIQYDADAKLVFAILLAPSKFFGSCLRHQITIIRTFPTQFKMGHKLFLVVWF